MRDLLRLTSPSAECINIQKVAGLARIAKGQLGLPNNGFIPIDVVTVTDMLCDDESWVSHNGKIQKMKERFWNTMGYRQHRITSFGQKIPVGNRGKYSLESPPRSVYTSYNQGHVGERYGWVEVIDPRTIYTRGTKAKPHGAYNLCQCVGCGDIKWICRSSLRRGVSKGCQNCSQPERRIPIWLDRRLTAAKQRCENPNNSAYRLYGERGIKFSFSCVSEAGLYLIQKYGVPDRKMEIDRIDSNGNYAPGNLRFVTKAQNLSNQRRTVLTKWSQEYWPFAYGVVIRKLSAGLTRAEIIQSAQRVVREKRKNWRTISARLDFMVCEMPDNISILPYRVS